MRYFALSQTRTGFTFVEMLLVMAVITILSGILLPVYFQGRNRARSVRCVSQLKQLGMAASLYASDYSGTLPAAMGSPFSGSFTRVNGLAGTSSSCACDLLRLYTGSNSLVACPNDRGAPAFGFHGKSVYSDSGTSYLWEMSRVQSGWRINGQHLSRLSPQDILFRDYGTDWHGSRARDGLNIIETAQANAVFADGRASSMSSYSLSTRHGEYLGWATIGRSTGRIWIAGTTDYGSAYLYGAYRTVPPTTAVAGEHVVSTYGMIYSSNGTHEVDRIFRLSSESGFQLVFRQITLWIEGILEQ